MYKFCAGTSESFLEHYLTNAETAPQDETLNVYQTRFDDNNNDLEMQHGNKDSNQDHFRKHLQQYIENKLLLNSQLKHHNVTNHKTLINEKILRM